MQRPPKPRLSDLDAEERVSLGSALGEAQQLATSEGVTRRANGDFTKADGVPIPTALDLESPESAVAWVEREVLKATPRAIQEVIHQIRTGEKKQRLVAALQILDRAGVQAKAQATTIAPVIVLTKNAIESLPWVKQAKASGQIIDGQIVNGTVERITGIADAKKER